MNRIPGMLRCGMRYSTLTEIEETEWQININVLHYVGGAYCAVSRGLKILIIHFSLFIWFNVYLSSKCRN